MYYTIYKTTNLINNKIYIGKHQTENLNDDYMGSGKHFKRAEQKYGTENFKKEVLFMFDTELEMNQKEAEIVTEEFVKLDSNYNLCPGGKGGWGYINSNEELIKKRDKYEHKLAGRIASNRSISKRKQSSLIMKQTHFDGKFRYNGFLGKKHSNESKILMGLKTSVSQTGESNSQYGTMWITNGIESKKIKNNDFIPENWYKGRKIKPHIVS